MPESITISLPDSIFEWVLSIIGSLLLLAAGVIVGIVVIVCTVFLITLPFDARDQRKEREKRRQRFHGSGKTVILVYHNDHPWADYIKTKLIPQLRGKAISVNWSLKQPCSVEWEELVLPMTCRTFSYTGDGCDCYFDDDFDMVAWVKEKFSSKALRTRKVTPGAIVIGADGSICTWTKLEIWRDPKATQLTGADLNKKMKELRDDFTRFVVE